MAKENKTNAKRVAINAAYSNKPSNIPTPFLQSGRNNGYSLAKTICRALNKVKSTKSVHFATANKVTQFDVNDKAAMITFDSGADGHYLSEEDQK